MTSEGNPAGRCGSWRWEPGRLGRTRGVGRRLKCSVCGVEDVEWVGSASEDRQQETRTRERSHIWEMLPLIIKIPARGKETQ